jgi:hypothetical protein
MALKRQKGSLSKVTSEMKATIAATGETPLEYMAPRDAG